MTNFSTTHLIKLKISPVILILLILLKIELVWTKYSKRLEMRLTNKMGKISMYTEISK